jgi:hypothetical protein
MRTFRICNQLPNVLDLSDVQNTDGLPITLRAKGTAGDTCECPQEMEDNPVLLRVKNAGWVTVIKPEVMKIAPTPEPIPTPKPVIENPIPTPEPVIENPIPTPHATEIRKAKRR